MLPEGRLAQQLAQGRPLRVKLGIDPTAPDIHLGHVVVLDEAAPVPGRGPHRGADRRRLHGPDRRPQRTVGGAADAVAGEIDANAATFQEQAFKVLDPERTEVRRNGEWLDMGTEKLFGLLRNFTIARMLERDDFRSGCGPSSRSRRSSCSTR